MAENLDCADSNLLCSEITSDFDCSSATVDEFGLPQNNLNLIQDSNFNYIRSDFLMGVFPLLNEESFREMVEKERHYMPKDDYLERLRSGALDLSVRKEALDWIFKASQHFRFGPSSVCLSMNYFDRFLSVYELPRDKNWTVQLLAVACLSLAAKIEETEVPQSVELQVGEPKFVFEAKTIQRMELLVLSSLKWRMQSFTPYSFIDYYLSKINEDENPSTTFFSKSSELIFSTIKGIDFLQFSPSEISAAVAISASADMQPQDIDEAMSMCCYIHVEKEKVLKCVELIEDLSLNGGIETEIVPQSPDGVLDAACLSYKSDELTVGSCANSSPNIIIISPEVKRRRQDRSSHSQED
ncbi:cyclin-D4-2-like [Pistacia vera]|uniref:cyclin-D4-2-like n=1 Tax=Pistacia vera TaxID=55513 RepID=UPI0012633D12|nr:cyclin-D4-2-like [Pistacia vera]